MSIANPILEARSWPRAIPMTRDVLRRLQGDAERLVEQLPRLQMLAQENGVSGDPDSPTIMAAGDLHLAARRLETLRRVIADGLVVEPDGRIVVGSRIGVRHADGESETYDLVAPGETDARLGRISPDSPLGAALLGRRADDVTHMDAPAGRVQLTITSVSTPTPALDMHSDHDHTEQARDIVHEQSMQSFPASDAPSWTGASI
jgi:GreA/GreB family transcription elongation factor